MKTPEIPQNEKERMEAVERMKIVSTPREADLDKLTQAARHLFGTSISAISIIESDRQWFKSRVGLKASETPRDVSFCGHAINSDQTMVVQDTLKDVRFADNPLVTGDPEIRFYAGHPVCTPDGYKLGTLCIIDNKPREFNQNDAAALSNLARLAEVVLEHRKLTEAQSTLLDCLISARRDKLIDPLTGVWNRAGFEEMFEREFSRCVRKKAPIALAMIDADDFKVFNDLHGHHCGDTLLISLASTITSVFRRSDVVARYGGDEFVVLLPETNVEVANHICEKLLHQILMLSVDSKLSIDSQPSVSVGIVVKDLSTGSGETLGKMIREADEAMYASKHKGKNNCTVMSGARIAT